VKHAETAARARLSLLAPSPPHARPLSHSAARACRLHSRRRGCVPAWLVQSAGRRRRAVRQRAARAHTESRPVLRIAPIFRGRASTETAPSRPLCPRRSRASTRSRASKQGRQRSAAPSLVERGGGRGERARRALSHRTVAEGGTAPAQARTGTHARREARRTTTPPTLPPARTLGARDAQHLAGALAGQAVVDLGAGARGVGAGRRRARCWRGRGRGAAAAASHPPSDRGATAARDAARAKRPPGGARGQDGRAGFRSRPDRRLPLSAPHTLTRANAGCAVIMTPAVVAASDSFWASWGAGRGGTGQRGGGAGGGGGHARPPSSVICGRYGAPAWGAPGARRARRAPPAPNPHPHLGNTRRRLGGRGAGRRHGGGADGGGADGGHWSGRRGWEGGGGCVVWRAGFSTATRAPPPRPPCRYGAPDREC
jgi:hypothetical protein